MTSKYHVVRIVDEYTVIVNYGSNDGAKINDTLVVYAEGTPLYDPISKSDLGTIDTILARIYVETVYEKFSVCISAMYENNAFTMLGASLASLQTAAGTIQKELPINATDIEGYPMREKRTIIVGDYVRVSSSDSHK